MVGKCNGKCTREREGKKQKQEHGTKRASNFWARSLQASIAAAAAAAAAVWRRTAPACRAGPTRAPATRDGCFAWHIRTRGTRLPPDSRYAPVVLCPKKQNAFSDFIYNCRDRHRKLRSILSAARSTQRGGGGGRRGPPRRPGAQCARGLCVGAPPAARREASGPYRQLRALTLLLGGRPTQKICVASHPHRLRSVLTAGFQGPLARVVR